MGGKQTRAVNYFIQYERINHTVNAVGSKYKDYQWISRYEDDIDREIFVQVKQEIEKIPGIEQLRIVVHEAPLYKDFEEKDRAFISQIAQGYHYRDIRVNTFDQSIGTFPAKILFSDASDQAISNAIVTGLPMALNLELPGKIDSIKRADFLPQHEIDRILKREEGIDLSKFPIPKK